MVQKVGGVLLGAVIAFMFFLPEIGQAQSCPSGHTLVITQWVYFVESDWMYPVCDSNVQNPPHFVSSPYQIPGYACASWPIDWRCDPPPQPKCTDPAASNYGGSLPCSYPTVCETYYGTASCSAHYPGTVGTISYSQEACTTAGVTTWKTPNVISSNCSTPPPPPPPTPTCTDPGASNYGGSLPCTYPPAVCTNPSASNYGGSLPCTFPSPTCNNGATNPPACNNNNVCTGWSGYYSCSSYAGSYGIPSNYTEGTFYQAGDSCNGVTYTNPSGCSAPYTPPPPPSYSGCSASTVNYCSVSVSGHDGYSGSCQAGTTGNCSYHCYDGSWTFPSTNTCAPISVELTASPRIVEVGTETTFTATLNGHTNCTVTGGNRTIPISSTTSESFEETINARTTFTLTCVVGEGTVTDSVTVETVPKSFET